MPLAIEFVSAARVMVLKVYGPLTLPEVRHAPERVAMHGCYLPGVSILLEPIEGPDARAADEVQRLQASLQQQLPLSRIAVAWPRSGDESPDGAGLAEAQAPAFRGRAEAIKWLARRA